MNRSRFLISASALAAAAFLREAGLACAGTTPASQFEALISTIVPFGADFPLTDPAVLSQRIDALFHLRASTVFESSLAEFASVAAFTLPSPQLFALERSMNEQAQPRELLERDTRAFKHSELSKDGSFASLAPQERARYLRLWSQSAFDVRRRFYTSVRAVTFEAFYSMPQVWSAIGYAGPILHRGRQA